MKKSRFTDSQILAILLGITRVLQERTDLFYKRGVHQTSQGLAYWVANVRRYK